MEIKMSENYVVTVGLIKGRHEMPVSGYIFDEDIKDVFDFKSMDSHIEKFLDEHVGLVVGNGVCINQADWYTDMPCYVGKKNLVVYVTGLTCVTASLIKVCMCNGVNLTLMHFDRESGDYKPQVIL